MTTRRFLPTLNWFVLICLVLTSCSGIPSIPRLTSNTPTAPAATAVPQVFPPAIIETDPPLNTVIGHQSPITFYFNQPMNKPSVESALNGLPDGTFTWNDEATFIFTPIQPYQPDAKLNIEIANSIQSATGFGIQEPIQLSFTVADYLRATNVLPKADARDVEVDAAIVASFNQPVVPLGADNASLPAAFGLQPSVRGRGEWLNTSTYIFYPEPSMLGGTEYTVSLNQGLKTVTGVGLAGSEGNSWKFVTSRPRVVSLSPSADELVPVDAKIKLTFNQSMDTESVQSNFRLSGTEGSVDGAFAWNEDATELTFTPAQRLARNIGYVLNMGADAKSQGALGVTLGADYGAVLRTYDNFAVVKTDPEVWATRFIFNAPLADGEYKNLVTVTPAVDNFDVNVNDDLNLYVYGNFIPGTRYVIELAAQIRDRWGQPLGTPFVLDYQTPPLPASLNMRLYASGATFVRPDEPMLYANAVNIQTADVMVAPLSLLDFFSLQNSYENQQAYVPTEPVVYSQSFNLPPNQSQEVKVNLTQGNNQLPTGLYYVNLASPQMELTPKIVYFVASSQVNLTLKLGATEAFIWAVDLPSQTPIANAPITLYDNAGNILGSGTTDSKGLWKGAVGAHDQYSPVYAILGQPGEENFALAISNWGTGIRAWDFGYSQNVQPPRTEIYMYTDRPIYRPGQTVYFRGVAREAFNGRYELPKINTVPINLRDANGNQLNTFNLQLTPFGTFHGEYKLSDGAVPGYYLFENNNFELYFNFQVAEYRKPEINLTVALSSEEIKLGNAAKATVNARYFFDAPAGNVNVKWSLYTKPDYFYLPNYQTGLINTPWLDVFRFPGSFGSSYLGDLIGEGTGQTTPEGILSIDLPAIPKKEAGQIVTLEVTAQDESGLPVSARTELRAHPADFYIGLRPDRWIGLADAAVQFEVYTVDWAQNPSGDKILLAEFKQVRWEKETDQAGFPTYTPVYTPVSSSNLATGPDGKARLSFIPPTAGTYMLDVSGGDAQSQTLIWVGGEGTAAWPDLPNQRIELKADRETYLAGDTARIFIPNPFITNSLALVTVERGVVSKADVITLSGSGGEYTLPLTEDDAPNVYVSVTVLGQGNDFRQGLVNIPVTPDAQELTVRVFSNPAEAGPRDNVTLDVLVTDNQGQPVEGEFSLSVVDQAVLALADPNAEDILPAFYSNQPLGIETGLSLAAYGGRNALEPGGLGGGGDGGITTVVREDFPDTAYWNPSLITNPEGRGQVTMTLPDSLTTWHVDVRGLTVDTKVGQAETQIVSTKPLLIRPVTPRFLVRGDHVLMAAIVNNNTSNTLKVAVNLQSDGFTLDNPGSATRNFDISPNARARVEWWGTAGRADSADLVFSVVTSGTPSLQDSARPVWGKLPILQYTAPQAFVTGGVLRGEATQQEVISLPRTFAPESGGLDVELSPSLAGSLLSALEAMDVPDASQSAESILSYLVPNLEVQRALKNANQDDPQLTERVTANLNASVSRLLYLQNDDGGWGWWGRTEKSDPYISAYVLFGLQRARLSGATVDDNALARAVTFLQEAQVKIDASTKVMELDESAFIQFALSGLGVPNQTTVEALYSARDRMPPSSIALLALTLKNINPADARTRDLISNLGASAIRTASSAHWETPRESIFARGSAIYTTSLVVYALAQLDPANQIVFDAVRYLAAHRNTRGLWNLGHDNAWAIIALNEAMVGFGDLRADFAFNATLNGGPLASGDVAGIQITPVDAHVPLEFLSPDSPNLLTIHREDGLGRLYYRAVLGLNRPVEDVRPLDAGMRIERVYCDSALSGGQSPQTKRCSPLSSLQLGSDQTVTAQLTLTLPHDSYYVMVEDFIPAGMEILNRNLKTSQLGIDLTEIQVQFDDKDPFANGWGWWLFNDPQIRDEGILFTADYLPAGTYVLTYTLVPLQAGEYRVLPAHAWQAFFPEVQGTSTGTIFEIKP
jgi:alpha-2-macroglobulin